MSDPTRAAPVIRVHHAGDWPPDAVSTAWAASGFAAPPDVRRLVDDAWERAMLEPNRQLFDGPMCRLESWDVTGGRVSVAVSRTSYKQFWGTNIMHPELADRYGPGAMANPVGVSPALETADGYLLLGRRNAEVAYYPTRVHPFAGSLEPGDGGGGAGDPAVGSPGPDLFAAVRRELAEELGFTPADVELVRLTGLAEDVRLRQPELIFRVKSRLTRPQVEAKVERAEHDHSVAVPATPDGVAAALHDRVLTPVAVAALLLWGRAVLGVPWFGAASRGLGL